LVLVRSSVSATQLVHWKQQLKEALALQPAETEATPIGYQFSDRLRGTLKAFVQQHQPMPLAATDAVKPALQTDVNKTDTKKRFNGTLVDGQASGRVDDLADDGTDVPDNHRPIASSHGVVPPQTQSFVNRQNSHQARGVPMQDLSGYKDLSKPPVMVDDDLSDSLSSSTIASSVSTFRSVSASVMEKPQVFSSDFADNQPDIDTEFSSNVRTLIRLVNDLPEGVTKQTGAQIIRLTMEAMGISMEEVLTEAQSAQSEMLDAVRANIKKIEEYKTVIRKLESDIKYYQGKANELSEIIDLFILSNTSPKLPNVDELAH